MNNPVTALIILLWVLSSCSGENTEPVKALSDSTSYSVTPTEPPQAKKPFYSPEFRKAVLSALERGYTPLNPDTFELVPPNEYFSLVSPQNYFNGQQMIYFNQGETVRVRLKKSHELVMEEFTFLSTKDLDEIMMAMTRKLTDPREERFLRRPFTYWQFKNALCHIYTQEEKDRKAMDVAYEIWIGFQMPAE